MQMHPVDLNLGSDHLDAAANVALELITEIEDFGVTKDDVSHMILAGLGHVLGEDHGAVDRQPEGARGLWRPPRHRHPRYRPHRRRPRCRNDPFR